MSDYKYRFNNSPLCPYCDHEETDAWELNLESDGDSTTIECADCGEEYTVTINVSVSYDTEKAGESSE